MAVALCSYSELTATVNSSRYEVQKQVEAVAARGGSLNLMLLTTEMWLFYLSIGVSCRRSWRDGSRDRLKAEDFERMERIRVELEVELL